MSQYHKKQIVFNIKINYVSKYLNSRYKINTFKQLGVMKNLAIIWILIAIAEIIINGRFLKLCY